MFHYNVEDWRSSAQAIDYHTAGMPHHGGLKTSTSLLHQSRDPKIVEVNNILQSMDASLTP